MSKYGTMRIYFISFLFFHTKMQVHFCIRGRLGNAIFRYMASAIMCIITKGQYICKAESENDHKNRLVLSDDIFYKISSMLLNDTQIYNLNNLSNIIMSEFYQHDAIYKKYKSQIIEFIEKNDNHYVITDGVNAGDKNCEKYNMSDILNTPISFSKIYKNVLHLRLEDFVTHNLFIPVNRIIELFEKNIINPDDTLCIVCKKITTPFENEYMNTLKYFFQVNKKINIVIEHNDTLTDYYIMKEATNLICSKSTMSWAAAFFSTKIQKCYMPNYEESINSTCKYPIDNTVLY